MDDNLMQPFDAPSYDIYIHLSNECHPKQLHEFLESAQGMVSAGGTVTLGANRDIVNYLPKIDKFSLISLDKSTSSEGLYFAIRKATRMDRHLVILIGYLLPSNELLLRLISDLDQDPMFGTAMPRFSNIIDDSVWPLPGGIKKDEEKDLIINRKALSQLSSYVITPELLAACIVIRREVIREMEQTNQGLDSLYGELRLLLCRMRRRGYRNIIVNHAVLPTSMSYNCLYPDIQEIDRARLVIQYPDIIQADDCFANLDQKKFEKLLAIATSTNPKQQFRLLLDCRGMICQYNGTCHNILGLMDGFQALNNGWQIDILASIEVVNFFNLQDRYRHFRILFECPDSTYSVAILLNQPWSIKTVRDLHDRALIVIFNILDTIAWDILYSCKNPLDRLWHFIARFSDGLFYNSEFTRSRFNTRFPLHGTIAERVTYLSLSRNEYTIPLARCEPVKDYILIFGNAYDHKDLDRTLNLVSNAFPLNKLIVIGLEKTNISNATVFPSGTINEVELHCYISSAKVIVFPSFYEGFGIPVVQGLSYGRPVIVRQSDLWIELAKKARFEGQLIVFDTSHSLVEAIGQTLINIPPKSLEFKGELLQEKTDYSWKDCANIMVDCIEELIANIDNQRWLKRQEALEAILTLATF